MAPPLREDFFLRLPLYTERKHILFYIHLFINCSNMQLKVFYNYYILRFFIILLFYYYLRIALRIIKDPRFERLPCLHKGTYADDCLINRFGILSFINLYGRTYYLNLYTGYIIIIHSEHSTMYIIFI